MNSKFHKILYGSVYSEFDFVVRELGMLTVQDSLLLLNCRIYECFGSNCTLISLTPPTLVRYYCTMFVTLMRPDGSTFSYELFVIEDNLLTLSRDGSSMSGTSLVVI